MSFQPRKNPKTQHLIHQALTQAQSQVEFCAAALLLSFWQWRHHLSFFSLHTVIPIGAQVKCVHATLQLPTSLTTIHHNRNNQWVPKVFEIFVHTEFLIRPNAATAQHQESSSLWLLKHQVNYYHIKYHQILT